MKRLLLPGLPALVLACGAAVAQTPPAAPPARDPAPAVVADTAPTRTPASLDRVCLRETGTRIRPRAANAARERCLSHTYGRVWTQDDLRSTGQPDIADALRMLDPSIR